MGRDMGRDMCLSKIFVAAEDSDSESSDIHPTRLSPAEIARTTVEAHKRTLLDFYRPDNMVSMASCPYNVTSSGGFKIPDDLFMFGNLIVKVNAFIGMDIAKLTRDDINEIIRDHRVYYDNNSIKGAYFIGVDKLGTDVRVFEGKEVKTHGFPFKAQVKSVSEAKKQIHQLLYP
ncbi:hypothetical protein PIB30_063165 [Stylosanthes scabra]|uniref:Uncharacterized protein n=1 Tax=Stylosanthes scabra TaxID=79078 RepID=A0ABU6XM59_9FABA|nr:hypothetical protein [Stylosanthes scabra]